MGDRANERPAENSVYRAVITQHLVRTGKLELKREAIILQDRLGHAIDMSTVPDTLLEDMALAIDNDTKMYSRGVVAHLAYTDYTEDCAMISEEDRADATRALHKVAGVTEGARKQLDHYATQSADNGGISVLGIFIVAAMAVCLVMVCTST